MSSPPAQLSRRGALNAPGALRKTAWYLNYAGLAGEPPARASPSYESVMPEFDNTADPAVETVSDLTPGLTPDLATQAADPGWD